MIRENARLVRERVDRFARLGGVDLSRLKEAEDPLLATVEAGTANLKRAIFTFECPMCAHVETNDQEMPPLCTGPLWTDDHPPEVMVRASQI